MQDAGLAGACALNQTPSVDELRGAAGGTPAMRPTRGWRSLRWPLVLAALFFGSYVAFAPLAVTLPASNLDGSWVAVLGEAGTQGLSMGEDLIFTAGPLSSLQTNYLDEHQVWLKLALRLLLPLAFVVLAVLLTWTERRYAVAIVMGLGLLVFFNPHHALFLALPVLTALIAIVAVRSPFQLAGFLLGIIATAAVSLAKFTVLPLALVAFVIADALRLYWRRVPVHVLSYLVVLFAMFCAVDRPSSFIPFILNSVSVTEGYSDAMSSLGPVAELIGFLFASALFFILILGFETAAVRVRALSPSVALARVTVLAAYVFIAWKAGFVRHDLHSLNAWHGLIIAAMTYALIAPRAWSGGTIAGGVMMVMGLFLLLVVIPWVTLSSYRRPLSWYYWARLDNGLQNVAQAKGFIASPVRWLKEHRAEKAAAFEGIRRAAPLPPLDGTVDIIPNLQSSVLANGLRYRPRPSFQEYGTYTARLIELNRRSLIERGPEYLLFQPGSIDGRYPALAEGPLWPDILRYYEPASKAGDLLVLRRRQQPIAELLLGPKITAKSRFDERIVVPDSSDPQFIKLAIRKTTWGRLASLLFRSPLVSMQVTYDDGRAESFRIIPAIAAKGFLISPAIASATEFMVISTGKNSGALPQIKYLRLNTGASGSWLYQPEIDVSFQALMGEPLRDRTPKNIATEVERLWTLLLLRRSVSPRNGVALVAEGLLAHPPLTLSLTLLGPAAGLDGTFGIRDGAWQAQGGTDGACFKIALQRGELNKNSVRPLPRSAALRVKSWQSEFPYRGGASGRGCTHLRNELPLRLFL